MTSLNKMAHFFALPLPFTTSLRNPWDMKDITHHSQHAIGPQLGNRQPATSPDDRIMGQTAKQHHHLLGFKALFVAPGQTQALLVALQGGFNAPTSLIVERHVGQQGLLGPLTKYTTLSLY